MWVQVFLGFDCLGKIVGAKVVMGVVELVAGEAVEVV